MTMSSGSGRERPRETSLDVREAAVAAREDAVGEREAAVAELEEMVRVRSDELGGGRDPADPRVVNQRLVARMREANENLVLATIHANEMADESRRRADEITASEERFRSLVITSTAIVFHADHQGRIRVDPSRWNRLTGLDADVEEEQEPGWGWLHAVPAEDQAAVRAAWERATATRQVYALQHRLRRPDGSFAWVMARAVPLRTVGKVREWVGTMTDVSDSVRIEEAREHFIAVLGHDLRNPVSAILLSAELLAGARLPESLQATAARIARSGMRLNAMIRDMLDFARGRLGHGIPVTRRPCDFAQIVRDEVDELSQAHAGRTIICESTGDVAGEWDADRLEQVLSNLIGNAFEQGADPITVRVVDAGADVILSVHNNGAPIPAHLLPTIFEPYRRRLGDVGKGLGLGLYIVSQIVRAHHAAIAVTSTERDGTTFTIRWPRHSPPSDVAAREHDRQAYRAGLLQHAVQSGVDRDEESS